MKKAYIVAYCQQNLGDDMFVRSLVRRYPQIRFYCLASEWVNTAFREEHNLKMPGTCVRFIRRALINMKILYL